MLKRKIVAIMRCLVLLGGAFAFSGTATAGEADVVAVTVSKSSETSYRFSVTVAHDDAGWEHYADAWQVIGPDGAMLAERILVHPHVNEQPFTRSLSGVVIADDVMAVTVRARDLVHGLGGKEVTLGLPDRGGEVKRVAP